MDSQTEERTILRLMLIAAAILISMAAIISGQALAQSTDAEKQRLYQSLDQLLNDDERVALRKLQALSGKVGGTKSFKATIEAAAAVNRSSPGSKVLAAIDAIIEAEEPGLDAYSRGIKYFSDKQYDLAIQEFDNAIGRGNKNSYFVRGQVWLQKQNYDQAIADFTEAVKTESGNYFLYMYRAAAYAHKGEGENAIADYRRAFALDPDENTKKRISEALKNLKAKR
jgi:tetratricopeptide (TPR) repeat protein